MGGILGAERVQLRPCSSACVTATCTSCAASPNRGSSAGPVREACSTMPPPARRFPHQLQHQRRCWRSLEMLQGRAVRPPDLEYLPRPLAPKTIFNSDGAFYPHYSSRMNLRTRNLQSPHGRQCIHHVWAFTLGSGITVQPLWWHYKIRSDRAFPSRWPIRPEVYRGVLRRFHRHLRTRRRRIVLAHGLRSTTAGRPG